jgi:aspartokinase/homoserine dehydrogenase 1
MMITQGSSEHSICAVVAPGDAERAVKAIKEEFALQILQRQIDDVSVVGHLSVIAVTGEQMRNVPGIGGKIFGALGKSGVNVVAIAQGSSERNISIVVAQDQVAAGMQAIHDAFFAPVHMTTPESESTHVYLAGVGNIGSAVLDQLALIKTPVMIKGLINTKQMVLDTIAIGEWCEVLAQGEETSWERFVTQMKQDPSQNKLFVDCTSSQEIAESYLSLLQSGIAIVAANKKAMSSSQEYQSRLSPFIHSRQFRFETNVCAGLPVIGTMQSLRETGDEILEVEGVFSGTLSYLFNTYDGMGSFAGLVEKARAFGYTEPDPRDDLSGMDVARKLLILARVMGLQMELVDIEVENITPSSCREVGTDQFFDRLREQDDAFRLRVDQALSQGQRLRYLGSVKEGKARVQLQAVGPEHPAFRLTGSNNLISIRTKRYFDHPLVIQGPGAGAQVTAAGVVADILSCLPVVSKVEL